MLYEEFISLNEFFPPFYSQPALGHFNDDGILDLFFQHSANGVMEVKPAFFISRYELDIRSSPLHSFLCSLWGFLAPFLLFLPSQAQVVDGAKGHLLWSAEFVCPHLVLQTSSISTSTGNSAFLFWASEPITAQKNVTKTTVSLPQKIIAAKHHLYRNEAQSTLLYMTRVRGSG